MSCATTCQVEFVLREGGFEGHPNRDDGWWAVAMLVEAVEVVLLTIIHCDGAAFSLIFKSSPEFSSIARLSVVLRTVPD